MTATNHGLFGSFLAITLQAHPAVALCIAPFSHFLLDALPHFGDSQMDLHGKKFLRILTADAIVAVISTLLLAWVWSDISILLIACAFLAASPDLMWIYYEYINKSKSKVHLVPRFHSWIQWSQTKKGAYIEAVWFTVFFGALVVVGINR